jgi:hypothetical protein
MLRHDRESRTTALFCSPLCRKVPKGCEQLRLARPVVRERVEGRSEPMKEDGGFAFPNEDAVMGCEGMSLRDYFAAKAMQGALDNRQTWPFSPNAKREAAKESYALADAMLAERQKESCDGE